MPTLKEVMRQGRRLGREKRLRRGRRTWTTSRPRAASRGPTRSVVSQFAMDRGKDQLGTLGSGNHFVEVGYVLEIFDEKLAAALGLFKDQVTAIVHTGSRGLGHQVCDDYIKVMLKAAAKYGIELPDRQLCCAPVNSPEAAAVSGGHGGGGQFRLCQPADDHPLGAGVLRAGLQGRPPGPGDGACLRRGPQHRQDRDAHR